MARVIIVNTFFFDLIAQVCVLTFGKILESRLLLECVGSHARSIIEVFPKMNNRLMPSPHPRTVT